MKELDEYRRRPKIYRKKMTITGGS